MQGTSTAPATSSDAANAFDIASGYTGRVLWRPTSRKDRPQGRRSTSCTRSGAHCDLVSEQSAEDEVRGRRPTRLSSAACSGTASGESSSRSASVHSAG
jgi:hypothetical protein